MARSFVFLGRPTAGIVAGNGSRPMAEVSTVFAV
jgi:hypothetical protein